MFGNLPLCLVERNIFFVCVAPVSAIDSGISNAVQQSSKLSMTKVLQNGRMETAILLKGNRGKRIALIYGGKMVFSVRKSVISLLKKQIFLK